MLPFALFRDIQNLLVSASAIRHCEKLSKSLSKRLKIQQTVGVGWGGEGRGNSSSKAFGISFADRPKAKRTPRAQYFSAGLT
jgi:hypothetical protein